MITAQHRRAIATLAIVAALAALPVACATTGTTNAPPQAVTANTASRVVDGLTKIQNWTNEQTNGGLLPVEIGRKITDAMQQAHDAGVKLSTALKAWDIAASFDAKRLAEAEVQTQLAIVNAALGVVLGVQLPPELVAESGTLIHNVTKAVADIQAALASGGPTT